jgi:hypothetical protein
MVQGQHGRLFSSVRWLVVAAILSELHVVDASQEADTCTESGSCTASANVASEQGEALLQRKFSSSLVTDLQESKSEEYIQIEQNVAEQRAIARVKLGIEGDLRRFKSKIRAYREDEDCQANAEKAFLEGLDAANLTGELSEEEKEISGLVLLKKC